MNIEVENFRRLRLALAAASLTLVAGLASATETTAVVARAADPITYQPYANSGIVIHSLARGVTFSDLDLSTPAGAADLQRRVAESANAVCARLGAMFPKDYTSVEECRQEAVKAAMVQVRAAIARAVKPA